jgi:hypothetical protein
MADDTSVSPERIQKLEERLEAVEEQVSDPEGTVKSTATSVSKLQKITVIGYTQIRYTTSQDSKDDTSVVDGFRVRRARLGLILKPGSDVLGKVTFDGAGGFTLKDCYVAWMPWHAPELGPSITLGQQPWCFGREVPVSSAVRETPERALWSRKLFEGERDLGLVVTSPAGQPLLLQLGVYNGSGINTKDNNANKDVVGRLGYTPTETVEVGVSGYFGKQLVSEQSWVKNRYGADVTWLVWDGFTLKAEGVLARETGKNPYGWQAQANLNAGRKAIVVVRYDVYDSDGLDEVRRTNTWQVGIIRYLHPNLKAKAFFEMPNESGKETRNNRLTFETVLQF